MVSAHVTQRNSSFPFTIPRGAGEEMSDCLQLPNSNSDRWQEVKACSAYSEKCLQADRSAQPKQTKAAAAQFVGM